MPKYRVRIAATEYHEFEIEAEDRSHAFEVALDTFHDSPATRPISIDVDVDHIKELPTDTDDPTCRHCSEPLNVCTCATRPSEPLASRLRCFGCGRAVEECDCGGPDDFDYEED